MERFLVKVDRKRKIVWIAENFLLVVVAVIVALLIMALGVG
jgi:hypothetical protein